jgi:tripartite-type tricarboxylate transporter receptor subunit TctC
MMIAAAALAALSTTTYGQAYPNRLIRIVVGGIGGSLDITARLVAQGIAGPLGQSVIVENRPSVTVAADSVAKAPPDGYTLLMTGSNLWLLPFLDSNTTFDPIRDFTGLTLATSSPSILVVHPLLPVKSVRDLIALAKARPGQLNYASGASGSASHLAAELFKAKADVNIMRINYKSAALGLIDLMGGQVQVMFPVAASVAQYLKAGKLKALGVTSRGPSSLAPGVPPISQAGVPGYEAVSITGLFAPAKLPEAITTRLNQEMVRVLKSDDAKQKFLVNGVEGLGSSPEELTAFVKSEMATMGKLIRDAGIKGD